MVISHRLTEQRVNQSIGKKAPRTAKEVSISLEERFPTFRQDVIIIAGGYGSGKSEVAVNLARQLASAKGETVQIADLDIVNPYFRSREAALELEKFGVKSIIPTGSLAQADLPIIIPQIKGAVEQRQSTVVLDVGGDDVGARVLKSLGTAFKPGQYELLLVLNANRPFTSTVAGTVQMIEDIELASSLNFTGIISNTHLMDDTTEDVLMAGIALSEEVAKVRKLPIAFISAERPVLESCAGKIADHALLALDRSLKKPWEQK
ncbi:MAG: cobalamin biosynthesis protein CbiA [candidate division Zixibacteria bacterium]